MSQTAPLSLTVPHACARHDISRSYLYRLAGEGKVIFRKHGRRTLVDVESLDRHFSALPVAQIKGPRGPAMEAAE